MQTVTMICDKCGNVCKEDYFTVYRTSQTKGVVNKTDICDRCYALMLNAIDYKLEGEEDI